MANRYANLVGSNKIKDEWQKINQGFDAVEADMNQKAAAADLTNLQNTVNDHIGAGGNAHAAATTSQAGFMSAADKQKLDGIETGAEVNQNAFAKVNDVEAADPSDELTITGGTGITITTNPNTKEVIVTATGEATPGPHGPSHTEHGADPIPTATTTEGGLMSADHVQMLEAHASRHATGGADPLTPEMIGAETPGGAQEKADQAEANAKAYADATFIPKVGDQAIIGRLSVRNSLRVIGNATGDPNIALVEFYDSNGTTRRGAVGDAASGNDDIHIVADTGDVVVLAEGSQRLRIEGAGNVRPGPDNVQNLGTAQFRWKEVFAGTGTINTSDENEKEQIESLNQAERNVATAIKGLIKKFKYRHAVQLKGPDARIHVGVIAQEVAAAFAAEGLDAHQYGLFCEDTWWEREEVRTPMIENPNFDPDQPEGEDNPRLIPGEPYTETVIYNEPVDGGVQRTRLGIRYDELLAFVIAAL